MPKRALWQCHWCGGLIYSQERSKVHTTKDGVFHYHYDGKDCLEEELAHRRIQDVDDEWEHDCVRGED